MTAVLHKLGCEQLLKQASRGEVDKVLALLDWGGVSSTDCVDANGFTPLMLAARAGNSEVLSILLCRGARSDLVSSSGATALMLAAAYGRQEAVRTLLNAGAGVHCVNKAGFNALHLAVISGSDAMTRMLLESGADPSVPNCRGLTTLWSATSLGYQDIVSTLLKAKRGKQQHEGAAPGLHQVNERGETLLMTASQNARPDIVALLLQAGANVHAQDCDGATALSRTVASARAHAVRLYASLDSASKRLVQHTSLHSSDFLSQSRPLVVPSPDASAHAFPDTASIARDCAWLEVAKLLVAAGGQPLLECAHDARVHVAAEEREAHWARECTVM
jgi:ankyrin repeat protein